MSISFVDAANARSTDTRSLSIPARLGDSTAVRLPNEKITFHDSTSSLSGLGAGDTVLNVNFLGAEEASQAAHALREGGEIAYQQWFHMPSKAKSTKPLLPLRRIKMA